MMNLTVAVPCVVCGAEVRAHELAVGTWSIARCRGCGLRTLDPMPAEVELDGFEDGSEYDAALALRDDIMRRHARTLASLERAVKPGRLLDVGSGPGLLLEAARSRGWHAVGVDPSSWAVDRARSLGFEAHHGMLEDLSLPSASFDSLALLQVVEHVPDPRPLLASCRALLRPGGALLVATPNPSSLLARAKGETFNYWIPPVHCVWYTPGALARLLETNGFRVVTRATWSARSISLHDGIDVVSSTRLGARAPWRVKRMLGEAVAAVADRTRLGTIVEQIAIRA